MNGNKSLLLRDVDVKDDGVYSCLATNEAGNISTQTNLTVHGEYMRDIRASVCIASTPARKKDFRFFLFALVVFG